MAATKTKRQGVDQPLRHGYLTHRDAIWAAVRELKTGFTVGQLESKTRASQDTIKSYLQGLTAAGYLERTDNRANGKPYTRYEKATWNLIKDAGVDSPRINKQGEQVTQGQGRINMWRTMRIIGQFSIKDLAIKSSTELHQVKEQEAKSYIKYLKAAGYIRVLRIRRPHQPTIYQFINARYTGPKPPMVQNIKQVFDPNLGKVVWTGGAA